MSNVGDFYRQKGLNELKSKVDSTRFLTTEQRELIHQIIDEEMDNDVKDKLRSMTDKQKRALKRKLSGQNEEVEEVEEVEEEMDNDVKDKLRSMTDKQKRALKRKLSDQNEDVDLDEGVKLIKTDYDLDQMVLTFDVNGTKQQFVYWDYDENWKNTKSKDVLDQLSKEKWYNSLDNSTKKKVLDSATKSIRSEGVYKEDVDLDEGEMPSSVIKAKQKLANMSDSEFAEKHKDKSDADLQAMAWRHGYGKGSNFYVDKKNKRSKTEQNEEVEKEINNDVKDKLRSMTDKQKRALKRKLSGQNEDVDLDENRKNVNVKFSSSEHEAVRKALHAAVDHWDGKETPPDYMTSLKRMAKRDKSWTFNTDEVQFMYDAIADLPQHAKTATMLKRKLSMAEDVELDENLSFAEKQDALIKFGYDPINVRYMNCEILEQAYESMINILKAQNPTLAEKTYWAIVHKKNKTRDYSLDSKEEAEDALNGYGDHAKDYKIVKTNKPPKDWSMKE